MLERTALYPRAMSRRLLSLRARCCPSHPIHRRLFSQLQPRAIHSPRKSISNTRRFCNTTQRNYVTPPIAHATEPTEISTEEYHDRADEYLDSLLARLEEIAEKDESWDVEYSSGVLNATVPDKGTYVLNKQPPNKQIWLSSPVSGPKRYDWVAAGDGVEADADVAGDWVYLRTGETLSALVQEELGVDMTEALVD